MLTAKEYYLWSRFICETFYDEKEECKNCIFQGEKDCCVSEIYFSSINVDYLIAKVEEFKDNYMKEHYSESLLSLFKRKFPNASEEVRNLCPKFIFGEEVCNCEQEYPSLCSVGHFKCWDTSFPLDIIPPEVENVMKNQ